MNTARRKPSGRHSRRRQRKRADADGVPFDRVAQVDLYFRLLDRLLQNVAGIVVKGGVALELRLGRARTTRDVDIRAVGNPARILERLRQAGQRDHGDYLAFQVEERAGAETIDGDGRRVRRAAVPGGGALCR